MSSISFVAYQALVTNTLAYLKSADNVPDARSRSILIPTGGCLIPVSYAHRQDRYLLERLTDWRNAHKEVFPTQFIATIDGTESWLVNRLLTVEDRILFLVIDPCDRLIGHMGFNDCLNSDMLFEIDNVIRGEAGCAKGIFSKALHALMEWASQTFNVKGFFLRVMDDNPHAIQFYKRNRFIEDRRISLFKTENEQLITYREAKDGELSTKSYLRMTNMPMKSEIRDGSKSNSTIPSNFICGIG